MTPRCPVCRKPFPTRNNLIGTHRNSLGRWCLKGIGLPAHLAEVLA